VPDDLVRFLPAPSLLEAPGAARALDDLHARLLGGEPTSTVREETSTHLVVHPARARLLLAEIALVDGRAAEATDELAVMARRAAASPVANLVAGRAFEEVEDWIRAVASYRAAASYFDVADRRAEEIEPRAIEELFGRIGSALRTGRAESVRRDADLLAAWRPQDPRSWRAVADVASGLGDGPEELRARRELMALGAEDLTDQLRRGALEVELGDANVGLSLLQEIAASRSDDPAVELAWRRARFRFRLANAPEEVRDAIAVPELTRAEFARLLFWLVPEVRTTRTDEVRIATDVFDHPAREELVRVANLGVLEINESLHLFEPDRPLRRIEAFRALIRISSGAIGRHVRIGDSREVCERAADAGWIPEAAECLPSAAVTGSDAELWIAAAVAPREGEDR
jgi:predicted Zn-dependent protease